MFYAQSAAYRSLDLDRQVGAAIVNEDNELISIGFNDVSKIGGGHFGPLDSNDQRDYTQKIDYNEDKLNEISKKLSDQLKSKQSTEDKKEKKISEIIKNEIKIITEFKRSTHAEMSALLDAARRGISVKGCDLYVNTYPCHNCAKHIIASGLSSVVFLHPYPKSEAKKMFSEMITHSLKKKKSTKKSTLNFKSFSGLAPNRFMYAFQNNKEPRQQKDHQNKFNGKPKKWLLSNSKAKFLENRPVHSYITREYCEIIKSKNKKKIDNFITEIFNEIRKIDPIKNEK